MLHFENDYNKGMHPELLKALVETNDEGQAGYGMDDYTASAVEKIRQACACPQAEVDFLVGGTQTNQVVIDSVLAPYEGVIAADTGHISVHEAGAIEFTGHKVLTLPSQTGKISADAVKNFVENFYADGNHEHMVFPGMVYISHPTEYGTLYTKEEMQALRDSCDAYEMTLFVDGARLGYALGSAENEIDLVTMAELADVFYIGGTKLGALIGEAVIFTKNNRPKYFTTLIKQHGALLAKGRLNGLQFDRFFTDNLYQKIGKQAVDLAEELKVILEEKGYQFFLKSPTNQQFVIMENSQLEALAEKVCYGFWETYDDNHTVIRFATSWSTTQADLDALREVL